MSDQSPRLRILLVGASGTRGRAVEREFGNCHDILRAGSKSGDVKMDIGDPASLVSGVTEADAIDTAGCTAGDVNFGDFEPVPIAQAALAFRRSREGVQTGQVYRAGF